MTMSYYHSVNVSINSEIMQMLYHMHIERIYHPTFRNEMYTIGCQRNERRWQYLTKAFVGNATTKCSQVRTSYL